MPTIVNALRGVPSLALAFTLGWSGLSFAQEFAEPRAFTADAGAQQISTATRADVPLRWRPKQIPTSDGYVAQTSIPSPAQSNPPLRAGWNVTRIDPSVRPAQFTTSDPFNNPFGDRQAAPQELVLQPTQAEASIEELPPPRASSPLRRVPSSSPRLTAAQQPGSGVPADPERISPREGTVGPLTEGGVPRTGLPCDRIYNDRNCCDEQTRCAEFRDRLLADSLRTISLDITPRFNPDLTVEEDLADRSDRLRLLELRQWKNRRGQVVATGKMTNLHNNAVVIADDAGNEVARLPLSDLAEDELCYITAWWRLPAECPLGGRQIVSRDWIHSTFAWHASAVCHKPLYFEEVQLERYGHTAGPLRQPIISGAHFFVNLAALPYKMAINPPHECQYALGYYRPGSCAPWMIPPIPLSVRGAAAEVGAALGFAYLIP